MNIALLTIGALKNPKEAVRITTTSIANELIKNGHNVHIITEHKKGLLRNEKVGEVMIHRYYNFPLLSKIFSPALGIRKIQKKENIKFDVIHGISATPLFIFSSLCAKLFSPDAKIIHTIKAYSRNKGGNFGYSLLNLAHKVTVPTNKLAGKLNKVNSKKIQVIHSPIRLNKFQPKNKRELRKEYGYDSKIKIIFYYGSMHQHKGADVLMKSIPKIINRKSHVIFIFAPRYQNITKERNLANQLNIEKNIDFITEDIKVEDYVNMADMVVLPYKTLLGTEGNPSCLLESMACKTLVVTSDLPELKEIFSDCVLFSKANDVDSLSETILHGLENENGDKIEAAFLKSQQFSLPKIAREFNEIYKTS